MPTRPMSQRIEPFFVSHGAPDTALKETAAHHFLKSFSADNPRPRAILTVSAHFETDTPALVTDPAPAMIYDFGGFDPRLRDRSLVMLMAEFLNTAIESLCDHVTPQKHETIRITKDLSSAGSFFSQLLTTDPW